MLRKLQIFPFLSILPLPNDLRIFEDKKGKGYLWRVLKSKTSYTLCWKRLGTIALLPAFASQTGCSSSMNFSNMDWNKTTHAPVFDTAPTDLVSLCIVGTIIHSGISHRQGIQLKRDLVGGSVCRNGGPALKRRGKQLAPVIGVYRCHPFQTLPRRLTETVPNVIPGSNGASRHFTDQMKILSRSHHSWSRWYQLSVCKGPWQRMARDSVVYLRRDISKPEYLYLHLGIVTKQHTNCRTDFMVLMGTNDRSGELKKMRFLT